MLLAASIAQADIYDDYKLLAESILTNSAKIEELGKKLGKCSAQLGANGLETNSTNSGSADQLDYQAQIDALKKEVEFLKKNSVLDEDLRNKLMNRLHGD